MEFKPFPKMARLSREAIITEKLDGTNAQIFITPVIDENQTDLVVAHKPLETGGGLAMLVGSRTRWITPGKSTDNYGFAEWVRQNAEELFKLGPGQHFGEWMGCGINRSYNLSERRFYLFNTSRWFSKNGIGVFSTQIENEGFTRTEVEGPRCCYVVPTLWRGVFTTEAVDHALLRLGCGSIAVPGFLNPEGVVVVHIASGQLFKKTLINDESPKGVGGLTHPGRPISPGGENWIHGDDLRQR